MSETTVWLDISLNNPKETDFGELTEEIKKETSDPMVKSDEGKVAFGIKKLICEFRTDDSEDLMQSIESLEAVSTVEMSVSKPSLQ